MEVRCNVCYVVKHILRYFDEVGAQSVASMVDSYVDFSKNIVFIDGKELMRAYYQRLDQMLLITSHGLLRLQFGIVTRGSSVME